jgi:hypothetical protein
LLAFSQVPGLILDFTQAEAKAITKVHPLFRYTSTLFQPIQKAEVEVVKAPASISRKRRHSSRHVANNDTEQDYTIPSMFSVLNF